jgi:hypothetical protein
MIRRRSMISIGAAILCAAATGAVTATASAATAGVQQTATGVLLQLGSGGTEQIDVRADRMLQVSYVAGGTLPARQSLSVNAQWPCPAGFATSRPQPPGCGSFRECRFVVR